MVILSRDLVLQTMSRGESLDFINVLEPGRRFIEKVVLTFLVKVKTAAKAFFLLLKLLQVSCLLVCFLVPSDQHSLGFETKL